MDIQGLFPITSIINHSCTANTICFATDGYKFTCKAVTDIQVKERQHLVSNIYIYICCLLQRGDELTTNYLHHHYHFYGLSYRAPELAQFWHFCCRCRRCRDTTEFGSLVSVDT